MQHDPLVPVPVEEESPQAEPTAVALKPPVIDCPLTEAPPAIALPSQMQLVVEDLRAQVTRVEALADRLLDDENDREQERRTREALFEKLDASKPQFQFQMLRPIVQRMASLFDLVSEWSRQPPADAAGFVKCMELLQQQFREVLELHGIEPVAPGPDEAFDRRFHHVVSTQATGDEKRHEQIATVKQQGYLYFGQNAHNGALTPSVIRPARVVTWKYDATLATPDQTTTSGD